MTISFTGLARCILLGCVLGVSVGHGGLLHAQQVPPPRTPSETVEAIRTAYQRLDYAAATDLAEAALSAYQRYTTEQLTEVHTFLGLIAFNENRLPTARSHFEAALSLTPDLTLDPLLVSPKIVEFFTSIQGASAETPEQPVGPAEVRYISVADPRPTAAMRSALVPGWGQRYKGERVKGYVLTGVWGVAATGTLVGHFLQDRYGDRYRREEDPSRVAARFQTYNRWYKVRNNAALAAAAIWLYSYADALLGHGQRSLLEGRVNGLPITIQQRPGLYLRITF